MFLCEHNSRFWAAEISIRLRFLTGLGILLCYHRSESASKLLLLLKFGVETPGCRLLDTATWCLFMLL